MLGWRDALETEVASASGRPEAGWHWIRRVDSEAVTYEELSKPGETFELLDSRLASAIKKILTGNAGLRIKRESDNLKKLGQRIKGRQLLFLLHQEFAMVAAEQAAYALSDLIHLKQPKAAELELLELLVPVSVTDCCVACRRRLGVSAAHEGRAPHDAPQL